MPLLVQHEKQIFFDIAILLLASRKPAIGDVRELHLLHELLGSSLVQNLEQPLVLRSAELCFVEIKTRCVVVTSLKCFFSGADERVDEVGLLAYQTRHCSVV